MSKAFQAAQTRALYDTARKWFALVPPLVCPVTFVYDAPFGRFTPKEQGSWLLVDGIRAWILMELVSLLAFTYAYTHSPLSPTALGAPPPLTPAHPPTLLASLYALHYLNRALLSPLRTPSRSRAHISVPLSAVAFNVVNGSLMGAYLSSPEAARWLGGAYARPGFWAGVGLWGAGFAGNVLHDEVLLDLRRKATAKGKARDDDDDDSGKDKGKGKGGRKGEHYAVPHGYLYRLVSYPNYLCEWAEWLGFALAAAPPPSFASFGALLHTLAPPHLFFLSEVFLMLPRAWRGHQWYRRTFPEYPKERRAVVPFVF